jgi:CheY-like chemotaxis protein
MRRILIIDNDEITLALTRKFLENYGYVVTIASSTKQALDELSAPEFDLIISEILMSGLDGFDLVRFLKKCFIKIPVVFLTVKDDDTTRREAKNAGVAKLISKRVDYVNLPHIVDQVLSQSLKETK